VEKIIINAADQEECRIAMLDGDNHLQEFYSESSTRQMSLSNIYKGVIQNVEPSLQAVFVNFGSERNGFLQFCDIHPEYYTDDEFNDPKRSLRKGQQLLVQVLKEPTLIKGAALTTYISLAGRFVVLTPGRDSVGVSRKIVSDKERARLRGIADFLPVPGGLGYIVRTVAEERTARELADDLSQVHGLWEDIRHRAQAAASPSLIYREQDLATKILRDYYTSDVREILVDDQATYLRVLEYIKTIAPGQARIVKFHKEKRPIFARHMLEEQIATIYQTNVKLKSGGSIVITPTEALVAIDVNSGKGTREGSLEETAFNTNMEAAEEIARQLRLRDLAGLVVIDFIDMREDHHRKEVERRMREATKVDKAKRDFGYISKFGLLEMTRQKLRPSIDTGSYALCPHCQGRGQIKTPETTSVAFLRQVTHLLSKGGVGEIRGRLFPDAAQYLLNYKRQELANLEERHNVKILVSEDPTLPPGQSLLDFSKKSLEVVDTLKPGQVAGLYDDEDSRFEGSEPGPDSESQARPRQSDRPNGYQGQNGYQGHGGDRQHNGYQGHNGCQDRGDRQNNNYGGNGQRGGGTSGGGQNNPGGQGGQNVQSSQGGQGFPGGNGGQQKSEARKRFFQSARPVKGPKPAGKPEPPKKGPGTSAS
jgi:ribonuclease E